MLHLESSAELSFGKKVVSAEIEEGSTFGGLLEELENHFSPTLAKEIYDSANNSLQAMVLAIINGTLVHNFDGLDTVLNHGDTVIFVPAIVGG